MHNLDLILTLAVGFIGALTFGYVTHRLGWSPIVGYLLAGVVVDRTLPGFVADRNLAEPVGRGRSDSPDVRRRPAFSFEGSARGAARSPSRARSARALSATLLGAFAAHAFGWGWSSGIVFGLALSVASTVVLTRVLSDNGELQSPTGRIAIGWLVMEDIFTVFVLVLLPVFFRRRRKPKASVYRSRLRWPR